MKALFFILTICCIFQGFNWKRCVVRTAIMLLVVLICETFPSFGQIQNLIGSVSTALLSFVLACIFYIKLCLDSKKNPNWPQRYPLGCYSSTKFFYLNIFLCMQQIRFQVHVSILSNRHSHWNRWWNRFGLFHT